MKKSNPAVWIWDILYPLLMYYAVIVIVMFLAQLVLGTDSKTYMLRQIIATLVTLPTVYVLFYKPDVLLVQEGRAALGQAGKGLGAVKIVLVAALLGISLNNILSMSPLVGMSEAFAQATEDFYAGAFVLELIGSAILTPILEEMVYRGIVYTRLKRHLGVIPAVVLSALVFGLMHFNIVQFIYARTHHGKTFPCIRPDPCAHDHQFDFRRANRDRNPRWHRRRKRRRVGYLGNPLSYWGSTSHSLVCKACFHTQFRHNFKIKPQKHLIKLGKTGTSPRELCGDV
jgi:membrane protease YdiL (CAAX protease family)